MDDLAARREEIAQLTRVLALQTTDSESRTLQFNKEISRLNQANAELRQRLMHFESHTFENEELVKAIQTSSNSQTARQQEQIEEATHRYNLLQLEAQKIIENLIEDNQALSQGVSNSSEAVLAAKQVLQDFQRQAELQKVDFARSLTETLTQAKLVEASYRAQLEQTQRLSELNQSLLAALKSQREKQN